MDPTLRPPLDNFGANLVRIRNLLTFDELVLDFVIKSLQRIRESQDRVKPPIENPRHRVDTVLSHLQNIRQNESLKIYFNTVHNQALVLLVSHFAAALGDAYRAAIALTLATKPSDEFLGEELKVTVGDLARWEAEPSARIADLLIEKKDLSFQDMKSTGRAFEDLCGCTIPKDQDVNDIIAAQACRHAIVHSGEKVTRETLQQVRNAKPRTLKESLSEGERIVFEPGEVFVAAGAMEKYLTFLLEEITKTLRS